MLGEAMYGAVALLAGVPGDVSSHMPPPVFGALGCHDVEVTRIHGLRGFGIASSSGFAGLSATDFVGPMPDGSNTGKNERAAIMAAKVALVLGVGYIAYRAMKKRR